MSGYIVYAAECRKDIQSEYKDMSFGEISRIVGSNVRFSSSPFSQCVLLVSCIHACLFAELSKFQRKKKGIKKIKIPRAVIMAKVASIC